MSYEEIGRRTVPQIAAILKGAGEQISIKMGIPSFSPSLPSEEIPQEIDNDTKLSQIDQIERMFNR